MELISSRFGGNPAIDLFCNQFKDALATLQQNPLPEGQLSAYQLSQATLLQFAQMNKITREQATRLFNLMQDASSAMRENPPPAGEGVTGSGKPYWQMFQEFAGKLKKLLEEEPVSQPM